MAAAPIAPVYYPYPYYSFFVDQSRYNAATFTGIGIHTHSRILLSLLLSLSVSGFLLRYLYENTSVSLLINLYCPRHPGPNNIEVL
jgi:hypothetical protein